MPILLLYGTDEFAISRRISGIASQTDRDGMNTSRFEARLAGEEELNNAVNSLPFLSDKRLVIFANPSQKFNSTETKKKFTAFLANVPSTTLLVLHEPSNRRKLKNTGWSRALPSSDPPKPKP